jgi:site-specific DNA recombinase
VYQNYVNRASPKPLKCAPALPGNSIGFSGAFAAEKLVTVICRELYVLEGFQSQFAQMLETSREDITNIDADSWETLCSAEELLDKETHNVQDAIAALGPRPIIEEKLRELEANGRRLIIQRSQLEDRRKPKLILPESTLDLRTSLETQFRDLAIGSPEFGNFMRLLVPKFCVYVVRSCDGGHLLPRAKVELNLAGTFPDVNLVAGLHDLVTRELTIDLFDPPQREEIRVEAVRLAIEGIKQRDMCCRLPGNPTQAAISKGILLNRTMLSLGLASPYVLQFDPPDDYRKLRRHKNARYEFKPLDGYERPTL